MGNTVIGSIYSNLSLPMDSQQGLLPPSFAKFVFNFGILDSYI